MEMLQKTRTFYILEGILFILVGFFAIFYPFFLYYSFEKSFGSLFILSGALQLFRLFYQRNTLLFYPYLLIVMAFIAFGSLLILNILSLSLMVSLLFFIMGICQMLIGFRLQPYNSYWAWLVIAGMISLILGGIVLSGWPDEAVWTLSVLVGSNMAFFGLTQILIAKN